jgi:hypothetical protein
LLPGFWGPDANAERMTNYQSEPANRPLAGTNGRAARAGAGWFSFDMPVESPVETAIIVTYFNELGLPPTTGSFDIVVDGTTIAHFEPNARATGFFDAKYAVPSSLTRGKSKVTVRFQAAPNGRIAPVFAVRSVRADQM